jgi:hypothetical protein
LDTCSCSFCCSPPFSGRKARQYGTSANQPISQYSPPQPTESEAKEAKYNQAVSPIVRHFRPTSFVRLQPSRQAHKSTPGNKRPASEQPTQENYWTKYFPEKWSDWLLVGFNGLLALFTYLLWKSTDKLWAAGEKQIAVARDAADAARRSAETGRQALISAQRAWIKINKIDIASANPGSGLTLDHNWANIPICFRITNVGTAPALKVKLMAQMVVVTPSAIGKPYEVQREMSNLTRSGGFSVGRTIFPSEDFPRGTNEMWYQEFRVCREEIDKALELPRSNIIAFFYIVGFIDYTFPTDLSCHHQTGFVVGLRRRDGTAFNPVAGFVPAGELMLMDEPMQMGWYAD